MRNLKYIILFISFFIFYIGNTFANINLTVSPIKYEINASTGEVITKTATLFNYSDSVKNITTGKSDFQSNGLTGDPQFIRKSELVYPDQELASWITIDTNNFSINPGEKKVINFTITVPDNATPGGHYAGIFFKNNNPETSSGTKVGINIDYGVLVLLNVKGTIIENGDLLNTKVISNGGSGGGNILKKDDCVVDLSSSYYDGKCVDDFGIYGDISRNVNKINDLNASDKKLSDLNNPDFNVNFETLFSNDGNTHLKPTGKITLTDENGNEIKGVGKQIVKNKLGSIIGEKVVNYIPINDNEGNVLPYTKRQFNSKWKGFPYEAYDQNGKKIIKYWTPEEYYTRKNVTERGFILPWERVNEKINHKKINANIQLGYVNREGENIEFNSAKEFYVDYKEKYIGLNPYFFIGSGILLFILFLLCLIFRKKKVKCISCNKKIDKDMKICPYCGNKQTGMFKKKKS